VSSVSGGGGNYERTTVHSQPAVLDVQRHTSHDSSAGHVIRYVSTHAWTWPEYVRTKRTLDRSTVRCCTSLRRPFSAASLMPAVHHHHHHHHHHQQQQQQQQTERGDGLTDAAWPSQSTRAAAAAAAAAQAESTTTTSHRQLLPLSCGMKNSCHSESVVACCYC